MNSRTGARAGVQAGADLVERGAVGRRVAHQHQRVEIGESARAARPSAARYIRRAC